MLKDITLGQYFPGESVIHKLDPRFKILFTIFYIVTVFLAKSVEAYVVVAVFIFTVIFVSGIPVKHVFRGLKSLMFLIAFTSFFKIVFRWPIGCDQRRLTAHAADGCTYLFSYHRNYCFDIYHLADQPDRWY